MELLRAAPPPLMVSPMVVAEGCYLIAREATPQAEQTFIQSLTRRPFQVQALTTGDLERMAALVVEYADLGLGGTDASIVALAERLDVADVATLDRRHFTVVRPRHVSWFTLLPE